ncbi:hypothetical protein N665_0188s0274 [Sinapis alba]|nr:hypothetical protein N665_0188s0274 [Sinapis alba]
MTSDQASFPSITSLLVISRNDVDRGTWHFGLDAVATLHRNNLVLATVEDGDVTVHVVTDMVQIRIELAS